MERFRKQLASALALGMLMPQVMLNIASLGNSSQTVPEQTLGPTETVTQPPAEKITYLPVLTDGAVVRVMALEEYIQGVVLAEMPASFETEALKAQAVVARTYALRRLTLGDRHGAVAICTDSACCQAYISEADYLKTMGDQTDIDKIRLAVSETAGQVLTFDGALAEATYFSCSGGRTEDAQAVWGEAISYLQAVDSPGEESAEHYSGSVRFTAAQFADALGRALEGSPESWFGKVSYTDGGGVAAMFIGGISYPGTQLRQLLNLNSTAFTVSPDSTGVTVTTRGKGHRVGMSQYGADAMAVTGSTCGEILAHYYPGTRIDKIDVLG